MKNVHQWKSDFPNSTTKVTFSSEDLPYLKESIIHLWENGISVVPANVVFENVWKEHDDEIYEKQLRELADYVIENELWNKVNCTFFVVGAVCLQARVNHGYKMPKINIHNLRGCRN
jgi:hypothetical protein